MEQVHLQRETLPETPEVTTGIRTVELKRTATSATITQKLTPGRNIAMFFGWAVAGAAVVVLLWWLKPVSKTDEMSLIATQLSESLQTSEDAERQPTIAEEALPSDFSADSVAPEPIETGQTTEDAERQPYSAEEDLPGKYSAQAEMNADRLTDSITYLESKLTSAEVITDSVIAAEQAPASSTSIKQPVVSEAAEDLEPLPPPVVADDTGSETSVSIHRGCRDRGG